MAGVNFEKIKTAQSLKAQLRQVLIQEIHDISE